MLTKKIFSITVITMIVVSCNNKINVKKTAYNWPANITAPVSEIKAHTLTAFGDVRTDNYYWLNDYFKKGLDSTRVVDYLKAENKYYDTMMAGTKTLQDKLYTEMKARIKEKDESVPSFKNGYFYYSRQVEGKDYFVYCRKKETLSAKEEILLDVNAMAEGHNYYAASGFAVSMNNKLLAFGVDMLSRREYIIYIKNLETGEIYKDAVKDSEGDPVWANDNETFFYTAKNPVTLLSEKIKKHTLGTDAATDKVVYEEKDVSNYIHVEKTKSDQYILITSKATLSSEVRWIDANKPNDTFAIFQPREKEVLYNVDHAHNQFYIRTNLHAKNFKLVTCPDDKKTSANWKDLIPHNDSILISSFELFKNFLAVSERKNGLTQLHVITLKDNASHYLAFDEPAYTASLGANPDYNTDVLRFNYTSLTTPSSVYDYNMVSKEKKLLKQQEVLGDFKATDYTTERLIATAKDGTKIPISIVYKKGFNKDGNAPLLLYSYGS